MTGFKPQISAVRSCRSANSATATATVAPMSSIFLDSVSSNVSDLLWICTKTSCWMWSCRSRTPSGSQQRWDTTLDCRWCRWQGSFCSLISNQLSSYLTENRSWPVINSFWVSEQCVILKISQYCCCSHKTFRTRNYTIGLGSLFFAFSAVFLF